MSAFGFSATNESLEEVDADGSELVIGEEFGGIGENGLGLSAELSWVDGGGLVVGGVGGEERRPRTALPHCYIYTSHKRTLPCHSSLSNPKTIEAQTAIVLYKERRSLWL